jgi:hypothetical protein
MKRSATLFGAALLLAIALLTPLARPTHAAGTPSLEVSWEETRGGQARFYSWVWIKNVGSASSDGIVVGAWCGYQMENGDVTERVAKPTSIMPGLAPRERVLLNFDCAPWEGRTPVYGRVQATIDDGHGPADAAVQKRFF